MSGLYIELQNFAGGSVEECVKEIAAVATRLGVWVKCQVNSIEVLCPPDQRPELLWHNYQIACDRKATFVSTHVIPNPVASQ